MPIQLTKRVARKSSAFIHEKSKTRTILLSLEPTAFVGVRLEGTRQTYRIDAEALYSIGVKLHEREIDRRASQIRKATGCLTKTARAKARKELAEKLK